MYWGLILRILQPKFLLTLFSTLIPMPAWKACDNDLILMGVTHIYACEQISY